MANIIKYVLPGGGEWVFLNPTVTVSQVSNRSPWGYRIISVRKVITVRAIVIPTTGTAKHEDFIGLRKKMRDVLEKPGGTFTWEEGGVELMRVGPTTDTNFGPHPTVCDIEKFFGTNSAMITWQIETEVAPEDNPGQVIEFIYSVNSSLDENFTSNRTIGGYLRLNAARLGSRDQFSGADCYRAWVTFYGCPCPPNWKRVSQSWQQSEDGLTIGFSITDTQVKAVLPLGCTRGDAALTVSGNPMMPAPVQLALSGFFEAPIDNPTAPAMAMGLLVNELFSTEDPFSGYMIDSMRVTNQMYSNSVQFNFTWSVWPSDDLTRLVAQQDPADYVETMSDWMYRLTLKGDKWLEDYKGNDKFSEDKGPYGTTNVLGWCGTGLAAPVLPFVPGWGIGTGDRGSGGGSGGEPSKPGEQGTDAGGKRFYKYWRQSFKYSIDFGMQFTPVKSAAEEDYKMQVRNPTVYLTVTGEALAYKREPVIPAPPYYVDGEEARLIYASPQLGSPLPGPTYPMSWKYILKLNNPTIYSASAGADVLGAVEKLRLPFTPNQPSLYENPETAMPKKELSWPFIEEHTF